MRLHPIAPCAVALALALAPGPVLAGQHGAVTGHSVQGGHHGKSKGPGRNKGRAGVTGWNGPSPGLGACHGDCVAVTSPPGDGIGAPPPPP